MGEIQRTSPLQPPITPHPNVVATNALRRSLPLTRREASPVGAGDRTAVPHGPFGAGGQAG